MERCYKYTDCCGIVHFQNYQFTEEQIEEIEKEAKEILNGVVEQLTNEINKKILEDIIKK